eukprot:CAMPEP_0206460216 /NCGR_PEP_ID=MMETSP0324_2-20121206/24631_1 /ASSEMBLY_ACC=CAM_ASM_000836 /TAXON_ID=2866 /ORGANISM="Crypthecodinium cohnii, Strain Seligo" /LENGTH=54 /DNA_ID=CAMNT_0053931899 /DNA_START=180 /DNA_END=341 /DNA_ORIENTATION=+
MGTACIYALRCIDPLLTTSAMKPTTTITEAAPHSSNDGESPVTPTLLNCIALAT